MFDPGAMARLHTGSHDHACLWPTEEPADHRGDSSGEEPWAEDASWQLRRGQGQRRSACGQRDDVSRDGEVGSFRPAAWGSEVAGIPGKGPAPDEETDA